jgi:DNA repair exonuclease SbcCD ATPase subunit
MKKSPYKMLLILLTAFALSASLAQAQDPGLSGGGKSVLVLEQTLDSLQIVRSDLLQKADLLTQRVEWQRTGLPMSASEHRKLEKQLKELKELENRLQKIESEIKIVEETRQDAVRKAIETVRTEIDRLIEQTEKESGTAEKNVPSIRALLAQKQEFENRLAAPALSASTSLPVEAKPWDSFETLRLKGDVLADREEQIRQESGFIEERIRSLKDEAALRAKVSELARDLDVFNEREELLGRHTDVVGQTVPTEGDDRDTYNGEIAGLGDNDGTSAGHMTAPDNLGMIRENDGSRSPSTLADWISLLESRKDRLESKADSLHRQSQRFYKESVRKNTH